MPPGLWPTFLFLLLPHNRHLQGPLVTLSLLRCGWSSGTGLKRLVFPNSLQHPVPLWPHEHQGSEDLAPQGHMAPVEVLPVWCLPRYFFFQAQPSPDKFYKKAAPGVRKIGSV